MVAVAVLFLIGAADAAEVTFVSPQQGSQVFGPNAIEVTTSASAVDRVEFYVDGTLAGVARRPPYRIAFDFGTELKSRTITAKVLSNRFRMTDTASIATAALTAGESISVDVVEVPLRVRSNRPLKPADLRVRENSVDQTVREITATRGPAHFAFIVDRSLSMGEGRLPAALRAVDEALTMLRAGDSASLVLFNHVVTKARPLTRERPAASDLPETIASGGTSLRDALGSVSARQRTYAIVITDGGDRNSMTTEEEALRRISGTRTIVAAVVLGDAGGFLQSAARNTGGTISSASAATVSRALRNVIADINSRYTVVYQSQGTKRGWRTIAITPRSNGVEIVSARKGYFAE